MRNNKVIACFFLVCGINILLSSNVFSQSVLPEALRVDLKRVEETWRILDKYAGQAWPGWNNYTEIPFRLDYPNGLSLHIGDPKRPGKFKIVDGVILRGKKIYLDDSRLNSLTITPKLCFAGGGAGFGKGYRAMNVRRALITAEQEKLADSLMKSFGNPSWPKELEYSTDKTIFSLIHELFHCFTDFGAVYRTDDTLFNADLNYAVFAEIEGDLLEKAAFEPDSINVKNYLKESFIAQQMKRRSMLEQQKIYESDREKCEGTAEYAAYRIIQLLKNGYEPGLNQNEDSLYFSFRYCDYFPAMSLDIYHEFRKNTLAADSKCYANGFFKCIILDKLTSEWKNDFFENKKSFDQLIGQLVELKKEEEPVLLDVMKKKYHYEELVRRHAPVIAARDSIIQYFQNPSMRFFVINIKEMAILPMPDITSSGTNYYQRFKSYYSSGKTNVQIGDMACEIKGIPICYDIRRKSIILPNLDSQNGSHNYDLKYSRQESDGTCYDVDIISNYFALHATKLQVIINPQEIEFRILPAAK